MPFWMQASENHPQLLAIKVADNADAARKKDEGRQILGYANDQRFLFVIGDNMKMGEITDFFDEGDIKNKKIVFCSLFKGATFIQNVTPFWTAQLSLAVETISAAYAECLALLKKAKYIDT
jgi:hypothetical protein